MRALAGRGAACGFRIIVYAAFTVPGAWNGGMFATGDR